MDSAHAWQLYYRDERERLGRETLAQMIASAPALDVRAHGAVIIPHTRLEVTGSQIARAVATVVRSGAERVLALGVLHGGRRSDQEQVAAARAGDRAATEALRGVHDEEGHASEEFSLDGFVEMLGIAAETAGRPIEVMRRYPFLVGDDPTSLPGIDELERLVDDGTFLVATTDPIHHGHAYDTPPGRCMAAEEAETVATARAMIDAQLEALAEHRFDEFRQLAALHRSDFRDTGPVVAHLVGDGFEPRIHELALVDYSGALDAPSPSWVAGALITV